MSGPRDIIDALRRDGSAAAIVDHLAAQGPSSAAEISRAYPITRVGARKGLMRLHSAGVLDLDVLGTRTHRYHVDPDALRYAARWLDAPADRAERANFRGRVR